MIVLYVFCYGPNDWRVEPARRGVECSARCTTREAAEAACRLLSGGCERGAFKWVTIPAKEYWR